MTLGIQYHNLGVDLGEIKLYTHLISGNGNTVSTAAWMESLQQYDNVQWTLQVLLVNI